MRVTILLMLIACGGRRISAEIPMTNVALVKPVTQSSLDPEHGRPEKVVDGNGGPRDEAHCTATLPQPPGRDQWVRVDLGDMYNVLQVAITNRVDCCAERTSNFDIVVSRELSDPTDGWQKNSQLCHHYPGEVGLGETVAFYCDSYQTVGRYVTWVKPKHDEITSFCEMTVYSSGLEEKNGDGFVEGFSDSMGRFALPTTNEFGFELGMWQSLPSYYNEFIRVPESRNSKKPNSTGVVMSPIFKPSVQGNCLTFHYQLTGSLDDMALEVTRSSDVGPSPTTVWSLKTPYNIKQFPDRLWRRADIAINNSDANYIWFNFIMTYSTDGDIAALDEFTYKSGPCPSGEPALMTWSCDFDDLDYMCGMGQPTDVDDNDWMRQTGPTSTKGTGPDFDHTKGEHGTGGHYLYFETSGFVKHDDSAVLVTPTINPTESDVSCVSFALHKHGLFVTPSYLAVKIATQEPFLYNESRVVWEDLGNHGTEWVTVEVKIQTPGPYKIFFQAEKRETPGSKKSTDTAIDDVTITNQDCSTSAVDIFKCSMDDMCGFRQSMIDQIDWIHTRGNSAAIPTPWANLTSTGPGTGGFLTLGKGRGEEQARLLSPTLNSGIAESCLTFWTHVQLSDPGGPKPPTLGSVSVYIRSTTIAGRKNPRQLWILNRDQENRWRRTALTIDTSSPVELMFVGIPGSASDSKISIDDIQVDPGPCLFDREFSTFQCDFSSADLCGFRQSSDDDFDWFQHEGPVPDVATTGPARDHTRKISASSGSPDGYMYIESSWPQKAGEMALMASPIIKSSTPRMCLTFWYHLKGAGTLEVYDVLRGAATAFFKQAAPTGDDWVKTAVTVNSEVPFTVAFRATVGQVGNGDIAIDDISVTSGECIKETLEPSEPSVDCDFSDSFLCGYQQAIDDDLDWTFTEGEGVQGGHMHVGDYIPKSVLVSPSLRWNFGKSCLKFRVKMVGNESEIGNLNVYLVPTGALGERKLVWHNVRSGGEESSTDAWTDVSVDIDTPYPVQLIFEGTRGAGANAISLDDVVVLPWECDNPVSCDFTGEDACTYTADNPRHLKVNKGNTTSPGPGPTGDHTTGTDHYLYVEPGWPLMSGVVSWTTDVNCLGVWYHIHGPDTGRLEVYAADHNDKMVDKQPLLYVQGERGNKWFHRLVEFNASKPIRIYFQASAFGLDSYNAIDDIYAYKNMSCSDVKPWMVKGMTSGLNCDFDNGLCGYTQMNQEPGYTDWLEAIDVSEKKGMFLQLDTPSSSSAVLISPELTGRPRKICLRFGYYVQYEPKEARGGVLTVTAVDSASEETVKTWSRKASDPKNVGWTTAEIDVNFKGPMKFRFEATPTSYGESSRLLADIAFDDVNVTDGTCAPVPWTEDPAFRCDRPTTQCAPGRGVCDPDLHTCTCTLPGAAGLQCTSECSNTNTGVDCTCPDGYYGDKCQDEMFHVECDHKTMLVNIRPHGFTKAVFKGIQPPGIRGTPCSLHSMDVFGARNPTYAAMGWQGYAAKFLLTDDLCAGSASVLEQTADNITYSRQVNVYYDSLGRHPTDTNLTLTCAAPKPKPPSVTITAFVLGVSALSRNPMTVNSHQWPTYVQFRFSLNTPNSAEMTEVAVEKCDASNGAQSVVVVANACVVHPTGVMLFDGGEPGTEFLMMRVYKRPDSPLDVTLRCSVRLCNTNKNNMSCYRRKMCLRRKKRASDWNQGTMLQDVTGYLQLDEGGLVHFNFTSSN